MRLFCINYEGMYLSTALIVVVADSAESAEKMADAELGSYFHEFGRACEIKDTGIAVHADHAGIVESCIVVE